LGTGCLGRPDFQADQGAVATQFSSSTGTGTSPAWKEVIDKRVWVLCHGDTECGTEERMQTAITAAAALVVVSMAHAEQADDAVARLLKARSIRCELSAGTQASWHGGRLKLERSTFGGGGTVTFDSIEFDAQSGRGRIIGNARAGDVRVLVTTSGLTFVEETAAGIYFTTVFNRYDSAVSKKASLGRSLLNTTARARSLNSARLLRN
jgi:hypothetical protein